ncbi:MAG: O-antigen ligase family protein [Bradymonadaceae bacterium]
MLTSAHRFLFAATIVAAPLAIGSVHTPVVAALVIGLSAALVLQTVDRRGTALSRDVFPIPALALAVFAAACLLQLVPVPPVVHALLSPESWAIVERGVAALPLESPPAGGWRPLSLRPHATADRALRWSALGLAAAYSARRAQRSGGWMFALQTGVAAGLAVLAAGAVQVAAGTDQVLFVYEPADTIKPFTTFINPNHANALFGLTSLCAYVLALESFETRPGFSMGAAVAGIGLMVASFEHPSVGGIAAYSIVLGLFILLFARGRDPIDWLPESRWRHVVTTGGLLVALLPWIVAGLMVVDPPTVGDLLWNSWVGDWIRDNGAARVEISRAGLRAAADFPFVGSGAGTTADVIPPYVDWSIVHPGSIPTIENEYIEWSYEYGIPVAAAGPFFVVGFVYWGVRRYRRHRRSRFAAAIALAVFLGVIAAMHFPFFTLGLSLPAVSLLSVALSRPRRRSSSDTRPAHLNTSEGLIETTGRARLLVHGFVVSALLGGIALTIWPGSPRAAPSDGPPSLSERARAIYRTAPADGLAYLRAARLAEGAPERRRALARHAFRRDPTANIGLLAAVEFWHTGDQSSAIDLLRTIFSSDYVRIPRRWILQLLVPRLRNPEALARGMAREDETDRWRAAAQRLRELEGAPASADFALELVEQRPSAYEGYRLLIDAYLRLDQFFLAEYWAERAVDHARWVPDASRPSPRALHVEVLRQAGESTRARELAHRALESDIRDVHLARHVVDLRTLPPGEASRTEAADIEEATELLCDRATREWLRRRCWAGKAWLDERAGDHESAEETYDRLATEFGRPVPLAGFLLRRGRCLDLNELIRRTKNRESASGAIVDQLERRADACAAGGEATSAEQE